jgi:hypothetical protein
MINMKNIVCFHDDTTNQYVCSQPTTTRFIQTNIPPPTFSDHRRQQLETYDITTTELTFALFSTYILFPLLYIILSTGNIRPIMILWRYIQSGVFNTVHSIKEYSLDVVYAVLRLFGQYSFSTYTVVKDGREIYASSSMFFFYKSDICSVYRIDRAKYDVCKWIDRQCKQYRIANNGEDPELTDTHNDIYDFIIHKVDKQPFVRIHRGDFSGRTHTLIHSHYRPFKKWYQLADKADITICLPSSDGAGDAPAPAPETFTLSLKTPYDFFLEKNEILDKKFLQWKLIHDYGRTDLANYIRTPFSTYTVRLYYSDCMNKYFEFTHPKALAALNATTAAAAIATDADAEPRTPVYSLNDSHSIIIGSLYAIKVDSVLRCPVFESGESQVYDIDSMLTNYYDDSDSDSDNESDHDSESDTISISDDDDDDDDAEEDGDEGAGANPVHDDPEFEMIEEPSTN